MKTYTYKDGLKILKYLEINSLNEYEIFLVKRKWLITYNYFKDPIDAIESLYIGTLPPHSHPKNYSSVMKSRQEEFNEKIEKTKLKEKDLDGILEEISL